MKTIHLMLKPASSLCNMRCGYCFYSDVAAARNTPSYGLMSDAAAESMLKMIEQDLEPGDRVHFAFQGGEPTLAGLPFFRNFVSRVSQWKGIEVSYALQTNGLLLDAQWCRFLKEHRFLVGLSLDLLHEAHDAARVDAHGQGTYGRAVEVLALLKAHGVDCNVLCTLTSTVARQAQQVWDRLTALDIEYTQFTPCLGPLDGSVPSPYALTPQLFASFYTRLFSYWYGDFQKGKRRSIKLFDDIVNLLVLGRPTGCGMTGSCQAQLVVEADGSVYPCDFYCLDSYRLGNLTHQSISQLLNAPALDAFLKRPHSQPQLCRQCPYQRFCGGSCKRMQKEICCSGDERFCGYRSFLEQCGNTLFVLAQQIRRSVFPKTN